MGAVTRYLTPEEKAHEVSDFLAYRADPGHFRHMHPDAHGGEGWIDWEVLSLVDELNELRGVCTVQSCCGHRWPIPDDPHGAEYHHNGQLWLRLSESVTRRVDEQVGRLLSYEVIVHVQKLYSYQEMTEPHEVLDVQWREGRMPWAAHVILSFFRGVAGW